MTIKEYTKYISDEEIEISGHVCYMNARDVSDMEFEFERYKNRRGKTYERSVYKLPTFRDFFNLYFQVVSGEFYTTPDMFVCTNYKVRDRLSKYLKKLEYHDTMRQSYCSVIDGDGLLGTRGVLIEYGNY